VREIISDDKPRPITPSKEKNVSTSQTVSSSFSSAKKNIRRRQRAKNLEIRILFFTNILADQYWRQGTIKQLPERLQHYFKKPL